MTEAHDERYPGDPAVTDPRSGTPAAAVHVDGVSLTFRGARTTHVLDHVDLSVQPGEVGTP